MYSGATFGRPFNTLNSNNSATTAAFSYILDREVITRDNLQRRNLPLGHSLSANEESGADFEDLRRDQRPGDQSLDLCLRRCTEILSKLGYGSIACRRARSPRIVGIINIAIRAVQVMMIFPTTKRSNQYLGSKPYAARGRRSGTSWDLYDGAGSFVR